MPGTRHPFLPGLWNAALTGDGWDYAEARKARVMALMTVGSSAPGGGVAPEGLMVNPLACNDAAMAAARLGLLCAAIERWGKPMTGRRCSRGMWV